MSGKPPPPRPGGRGPPPRGGAPPRPPAGGGAATTGSSGPPPPSARRTSRPPPSKGPPPPSDASPPTGASGGGAPPSRPAPAVTGSPPFKPPPSTAAPTGVSSPPAIVPKMPSATAAMIAGAGIATGGPPKPKIMAPVEEEKKEEVAKQKEYDSSLAAADAFLDAEKEYVEHLKEGFSTFFRRLEVRIKLKKTILDNDVINDLMGNYPTILNANQELFGNLMTLRLQGQEQMRNSLGQTMLDFLPYFKIYSPYIVKKEDRADVLESLKKSNKKFKEFVKISEAVIKRKIKSVLEEPVKRLPQYLEGMSDIYRQWVKEGGKEDEGCTKLFDAIIKVKQVTDEIATTCKDTRARRLVGKLQSTIFNDKILLAAPHRLCVKHSTLKIVKKGSLVDHEFILCNDILVIATPKGRLKGGSMLAVFPLIGLRVVLSATIPDGLLSQAEHRFAIIPQNKNFTPSESTSLGSVVIICSSAKEREDWIYKIEDTVDEEEHNLRPCNPVDLEKRLKREKTSPEGTADRIQITDPEKIAEIEQWKQDREAGVHRERGPLPPASAGNPAPLKQEGMTSASASQSSSPPPGGAPPRPPPPGVGGSGAPARPPPSVETQEEPEKKPNPLAGGKNALLAGIRRGTTLKKIGDTPRARPEAAKSITEETMGDLLANTLANYRTFVEDDDDSAAESEEDWS